MSSPIITTIIPTYRRPALLRRAVESVQAQSFADVKICIYDNASGDETEDVVTEIMQRDKRVHYTKRPRNIGPGPSMVQAVSVVDTPLFSLLNDDDFLLPDLYLRATSAVAERPEIGFVCSKTLSVDVTKGSMQYRNRDWDAGVYQPSNDMASKMFVSHFVQTGVVMRMDMTRIIGPFDLLGNDALFMTMAAAAMPFAVLDIYGSVFTAHPGAYSVALGLSSEPAVRLNEAMLSSIGFVIRSALSQESKFHLIMLIAHYYQEILDIQALNGFAATRVDIQPASSQRLLSAVTLSSVALALHQNCPAALQSFLRMIFGAVRSGRKRRQRRGPSWKLLPQAAHEYLLSGECDSKKFKAFVSAI